MNFFKKILCIGAGYVGGPTMAVIAMKCPEYKVIVVDINEEKINQWNSDHLPIYEPGLEEIVKEVRGLNLFFSTDIKSGIKESDIIFVSVNTPIKAFGLGAGRASDLQYWEKTAQQILENSEGPKIIVEKSTLPVKTAQAMERILKVNKNGAQFEVVSNPEFLAEGTAIQDLLEPDRVLIGSHQTESGVKAAEEIVKIYSRWVPKEKIITTNLWSSELSKLVANAFLAQRISSINSISALCEKTDADISEISFAIGSDRRIGPKFLNASVGFGGSCFKKDILNLVYIAESYGLSEVADYWSMVLKINEYQQERFVANVIKTMFNTVVGKKIAIFGFAFKANTGDTRESPAKFIARKLMEEKAILSITDPQALGNAQIDLAGVEGEITFELDPYRAADGASAIVLVTEWDVFKTLNYATIYKQMKKPALIFDGRNILEHQKLFALGFNVYPIGKPSLTYSY
jgi:UDPglucose 6-dehydrogenase